MARREKRAPRCCHSSLIRAPGLDCFTRLREACPKPRNYTPAITFRIMLFAQQSSVEAEAPAFSAQMFAEDAEHAAQRFGSTPEELVANGKGAEIFRTEIQLVQPADGDIERPRNGCGSEAAQRGFFCIGNDSNPFVRVCEQLLDFGERHIAFQLDGQRLAMTAHGADADADAVDWHGR